MRGDGHQELLQGPPVLVRGLPNDEVLNYNCFEGDIGPSLG